MSQATNQPDSHEAGRVLDLLRAYRRGAIWAAAGNAVLKGAAGGLCIAAWLLALTALPPPARWMLWAGGVAGVTLLCLQTSEIRTTTLWVWLPMTAAALGLAVSLAAGLLPNGLSMHTRWMIALAVALLGIIAWTVATLAKRRSMRQVALLVDRLGDTGEQWLSAVELAESAEGPFSRLQRRRLISWHERNGERVRFTSPLRGTIGLLIIAAAITAILSLLPNHLTAAQAERVRLERTKTRAAIAMNQIVAGGVDLLPTRAILNALSNWRDAVSRETDPAGQRISRRELVEHLENHLHAVENMQRGGRAAVKALGKFDATVDLAILLGKSDRLDDASQRIAQVAERLRRGTLPTAERTEWIKALRIAATAAENSIPLWRALTAAADAMEAKDADAFNRHMTRIASALAGAEKERADTEQALAALAEMGQGDTPPNTEATTTAPATRNTSGEPASAAGTSSRPAAPMQRVFSGNGSSTSRTATTAHDHADGSGFIPLEQAMQAAPPDAGWLANLDTPTREMVQRYFANEPEHEN